MKYNTTHPWLKFSLNVDVADYRLWLQLGEITSKCEHLSGIPLRPAFAKHLNEVFLAKGVLATTTTEQERSTTVSLIAQAKRVAT